LPARIKPLASKLEIIYFNPVHLWTKWCDQKMATYEKESPFTSDDFPANDKNNPDRYNIDFFIK
jgi:hypothetical protein